MFLKPLAPAARFLICFGLTAPSLLVTVACVFTFQDQARMEAAFGWVRRTLQVENRVHRLVLDVHEVEAGQRGYLFTGRGSQREAFYAGQARIPGDLAALRQDIGEDSVQAQQFMELEALVLDRVELARQSVELKKLGRHDEAHSLLRADRGRNTLECIQLLADEMRRHEANRLTSRDRELTERRQNHARWLYGLLVLNLTSLACTLFLLYRLGKAQSLARVCAWSKRIEHQGQWLSFEEYLNRRFDIDTTHTISPAEVNRLMGELVSEAPVSPTPAGLRTRAAQLQLFNSNKS